MEQVPFERAKHALSRYGINFAYSELAATESQAAKIALKTGFPIVMKIDSPEIVHKTEAGGVIMGINSLSDVHDAFHRLMEKAGNKKLNGILVQKQVVGGREVIVGAKRDSQFGATVLFGMGGIFVEVMKDVALRIAPITKEEALLMMQETKAYSLLSGARGQAPSDVESLAMLISKVSHFMSEHPEVKELDLNPCFALGEGYAVADVRMMI
jgi:acetyl-CoA synthetase (ADP-forming)